MSFVVFVNKGLICAVPQTIVRIAAALTFGALGTVPVFMRLDADKDEIIISTLGGSAKKDLESISLSTVGSVELSASSATKVWRDSPQQQKASRLTPFHCF